MTGFQKIALLCFVAIVLANYGKDIYAWLKARLSNVKLPTVPAAPTVLEPAQEVVDDLVTIAAMRDRFAADGCSEGAEACSLLLKIIIDHKHPHAG